MTLILIFTDIHGNNDAFDALLTEYRHRIDSYRSLGDVIGYYGRRPADAWRLAHGLDSNLRLGNHEIYVGQLGIPGAPYAEKLRRIGRQAIMAAFRHRALLKREPDNFWQEFYATACDDTRQDEYSETHDAYHTIWIHGSPYGSSYGYEPIEKSGNAPYIQPIFDKDNPDPEAGSWNAVKGSLLDVHRQHPEHTPLVWFGHTHRPTLAVICKDKEGVFFQGARYGEPIKIASLFADPTLHKNGYTPFALAINPGSVGQPRQGVPAQVINKRTAHAVVFDSVEGTIEFVVANYDFDSRRIADRLGMHGFDEILSSEDLRALCGALVQQNALVSDKNNDLVKIRTIHGDSHFESTQAANDALRACCANADEAGDLPIAVKLLLRDLWRIEADDLTNSLRNPEQYHNPLFVYTYSTDGFTLKS